MASVVTKKQLIVTVDDSVNVANVTRAIKMLRGVVDIRSAETKKKPTLCNPETGEHLNEKTMKVIEDVRNGKEQMVSYSSLEDFEKAMAPKEKSLVEKIQESRIAYGLEDDDFDITEYYDSIRERGYYGKSDSGHLFED